MQSGRRINHQRVQYIGLRSFVLKLMILFDLHRTRPCSSSSSYRQLRCTDGQAPAIRLRRLRWKSRLQHSRLCYTAAKQLGLLIVARQRDTRYTAKLDSRYSESPWQYEGVNDVESYRLHNSVRQRSVQERQERWPGRYV